MNIGKHLILGALLTLLSHQCFAQKYEDRFSSSEARDSYYQKVVDLAKKSVCWGNKHIDSLAKIYSLELDSTITKNDTTAESLLAHARVLRFSDGYLVNEAYLFVEGRIEGLLSRFQYLPYCFDEKVQLRHQPLADIFKSMDIAFLFRVNWATPNIVAVTKSGELFVLLRTARFPDFTLVRYSEYIKKEWPLFDLNIDVK